MKKLILILLVFVSANCFAQQQMFYALQNNLSLPANANIKAWYKSDIGVTGTTTVTGWADQSGNGNNLVNQTGTEPQLFTGDLNGYPGIYFGSGKRLINSTFSLAQPYTIVIVGRLSTISGPRLFFDSYNLSQSAVYTSGPYIFAAGVAYNATTGNTNPNLLIAVGNGTSGGLMVNNTTPDLTKNVGTNSISGISLGQLRGNPTPILDYSLLGYLYEIVIYNKALSADEIKQVQDYISYKYLIF